MKIGERISRIVTWIVNFWQYCVSGVWNVRTDSFKVRAVKTISLSVKSFLNADVQSMACAMTYRTVLALVPGLAMLFALGRGFGLQTLIEQELFRVFHAQHEVIARAISFVDSYLNQASGEGIFVGIGIVFLLWTLISLVSSVEDAFNAIWGVRTGRSIWRKITDYTAMLLILPVLMICSGGISVFLSSTLRTFLDLPFLTPVVSWMLEFASWVFTWLFFTGVYMLIPNARVRFSNALLAGVIAGTGFMVLQWIFVSGQLYVAKYNAIYGSIAFIPLTLIWIQLAWVITLSGAIVCFSSQNIFEFDFKDDIEAISPRYREKVVMAVATIIVQRFEACESPLTARDIIVGYRLPSQLVTQSIDELLEAGLITRVVINSKKELYGYQPAVPVDRMTVGFVRRRLDETGRHGFIPDFDSTFPDVVKVFDDLTHKIDDYSADIRLTSLSIDRLEIKGKFFRLIKAANNSNHHN